MKWSNLATIGCTAVAIGLLSFAMPSQAGQPWKSEAADSDFVGECSTTATGTSNAASPGGLSCYGTTLFISGRTNILRIRVSTAGDTHNGAALSLACLIRPASTNTWSFCNPTGSGAAPGDYITKNKMPVPTAVTNCDGVGSIVGGLGDGGGGPGDCHDNSIEQTWCVDVVGDDTFDIDIRIASDGNGTAFIEASTFMIASTKLMGGCGAGDSSGTTGF